MSWGTLGSEITLEGASSRTWTLRFERRLAPREDAPTANQASSVWLVRDESSARLFAAKRQSLASISEVDALVDEAAAWRNACLADNLSHIVELVDVFVSRTPPFSVTFLADFCSRGLLKKRNLSEPVLLTLVADLSAAAEAMPSPHAHIAYDAVLIDDKGCVRLAGFGAHRSAILRDNPGLTPTDDAFDIGMLLYELVFGNAPPEDLSIPDQSPYSEKLISLISTAFSHPHPSQLREAAIRAGAEERAPVVDVDSSGDSPPTAPTHVARSVDRNVERLIDGVDIAPSFSALLSDLQADPETVAQAIFKSLFKKPMSKNPLSAVRSLTMLHNLILDGPEALLEVIRKNDKFMEWIESSWTRESVEAKAGKAEEEAHQSTTCFAAGDLAFYSAFLRRKARFHMLAAGGFSGRWDRLDVQGANGQNVLATRRRKVISGMADLIEMASELGSLFAASTDTEAPAKHAGLGALVSECCLAFNAGLELAHEVHSPQTVEKLVPGIQRLYAAARSLVFAVERVPSAGGEDWVQQFADEHAPDIVADAALHNRSTQDGGDVAEFPREGWENKGKTEGTDKKEEKKKKRKKKKEENERATSEPLPKETAETDNKEVTAADGALVVHGADEAASRVITMFGDLLRIGDDEGSRPAAIQEAPRPTPDMTNAMALASAFGVAEDAVQSHYDDTSAQQVVRYGDDDEDDGGYENFQARQTAQTTPRLQGQSTAAWAARAAAANKPGFGRPPAQEGRSHDQYTDNRDRYNDDADSLDGDRRPRQSVPPKRDFYQDDYDSYESVEYNVTSKEDPYGKESSTFQHSAGYPPQQDGNYDRGGESYAATGGEYQDHLNYPIQNERKPYVFKLNSKQRMNMKKLRPGDKISESEDTQLSKGEYNRETVVVKKLTKKGLLSEKAMSSFVNEVEVMFALSHPNTLKCIAASIQKPNYVMVTEFMKRGSLFEVLYKSRIRLTWALIRKIALQVAQGMAHMHDRGYLHRDLKTLNILADAGYNVKIGDFGLSCHISMAGTKEFLGTFQYMSPEVLQGAPHSEKSDVFSFGHVLCEMVSGSPPFPGMDLDQVRENVSKGGRPKIPVQCQRVYVDVIKKSWETEPAKRPRFRDIVATIDSSK